MTGIAPSENALTSISPHKWYQNHARDDAWNANDKSRKGRTTTQVLGIFASGRDADKKCRLYVWWVSDTKLDSTSGAQ
jgi:hypothetical protein